MFTRQGSGTSSWTENSMYSYFSITG